MKIKLNDINNSLYHDEDRIRGELREIFASSKEIQIFKDDLNDSELNGILDTFKNKLDSNAQNDKECSNIVLSELIRRKYEELGDYTPETLAETLKDIFDDLSKLDQFKLEIEIDTISSGEREIINFIFGLFLSEHFCRIPPHSLRAQFSESTSFARLWARKKRLKAPLQVLCLECWRLLFADKFLCNQ